MGATASPEPKASVNPRGCRSIALSLVSPSLNLSLAPLWSPELSELVLVKDQQEAVGPCLPLARLGPQLLLQALSHTLLEGGPCSDLRGTPELTPREALPWGRGTFTPAPSAADKLLRLRGRAFTC